MLSIQGFVTVVNTSVLLLVLWLLLKLYRAVQNWEQRPVEDNKQPVALRGPLFLQDQWQYNYSAPCNRKGATEHDEF